MLQKEDHCQIISLFKLLAHQKRTYVLFGAGMYSNSLLELIAEHGLPRPLCIADDAPQIDSIDNAPVIHTRELKSKIFDEIILATDTYQEQMKTSLYKQLDGFSRAIDLYSLITKHDQNGFAAKTKKRTLIVFGNCISELICNILGSLPFIKKQFDLLYVNSYKMQKEKTYASMRPKIQNCKILIEQICLEALKYDNTPFFPDKDILPTDCRSIRFPALRFPLFWPTLAKDPRNKPEEGFPNGRFPIGDRLVISLMRKGLSPEEVFDAYINTDYAAYSNLDRAMELTEHQLKLLDKECDVSFSRELMDRFRKEHIFIDNIHPSESILERILLKILSCTDFNLDTVQENGMSIREHVSYFIFKGTLSGRIQQPIHPAIGRHFNIPWLTEEKLYLFPPFGKITFRQYLKEYINYSPIL